LFELLGSGPLVAAIGRSFAFFDEPGDGDDPIRFGRMPPNSSLDAAHRPSHGIFASHRTSLGLSRGGND
jgi:hypothetical protein